jgi:hypothetical protein
MSNEKNKTPQTKPQSQPKPPQNPPPRPELKMITESYDLFENLRKKKEQ